MGQEVGRDFGALGLRFDGNALAVAFCEPPTQEDQDALASRIGCRVRPVLGDPVLIAQALGVSTDGNGTVGNGNGIGNGQRERQRSPTRSGSGADSPLVDAGSESDEVKVSADVERLLEQGIHVSTQEGAIPLHIDDLLRYAVAVGASDLHLTAGIAGKHSSSRGGTADRRLPGARTTR